jgi:hypothetical protein
MAIPKIISVDDRVVEPPDLWTSRLPKPLHDRIPHVRREFGGFGAGKYDPNKLDWRVGENVLGADWADVWYYDDMVSPLTRGLADCGYTTEGPGRPVTYDEVLPGLLPAGCPTDRHGDQSHRCLAVPPDRPAVLRADLHGAREQGDRAEVHPRLQRWVIDDWCGDTSKAERLIRIVTRNIFFARLHVDLCQLAAGLCRPDRSGA